MTWHLRRTLKVIHQGTAPWGKVWYLQFPMFSVDVRPVHIFSTKLVENTLGRVQILNCEKPFVDVNRHWGQTVCEVVETCVYRCLQHCEQDSFTFHTETPSWRTSFSRRLAAMQRFSFIVCQISCSLNPSTEKHQTSKNTGICSSRPL